MSIELDNTTGVFLPGRTVNGRILMVSDDVTWNYFQSKYEFQEHLELFIIMKSEEK